MSPCPGPSGPPAGTAGAPRSPAAGVERTDIDAASGCSYGVDVPATSFQLHEWDIHIVCRGTDDASGAGDTAAGRPTARGPGTARAPVAVRAPVAARAPGRQAAGGP